MKAQRNHLPNVTELGLLGVSYRILPGGPPNNHYSTSRKALGRAAQANIISSAKQEVEGGGPLMSPPCWLAVPLCFVPFQGIPEIYLAETGVRGRSWRVNTEVDSLYDLA